MFINKKSKFAIVGHGLVLYRLLKLFVQKDLKRPIVITHSKSIHKRDSFELLKHKGLHVPISEIEKEFKTFYLKKFSHESLKKILKKNEITHIFNCSGRFIFDEKTVKIFKNKIFNLHPGALPQERGSGVITYRILNGDFFCLGVIHIIDKNIDTGKIVFRSKKYSFLVVFQRNEKSPFTI